MNVFEDGIHVGVYSEMCGPDGRILHSPIMVSASHAAGMASG